MGLEEVHGAGGRGWGGVGGLGGGTWGWGVVGWGVREFRVSPNLIRAEKLT